MLVTLSSTVRSFGEPVLVTGRMDVQYAQLWPECSQYLLSLPGQRSRGLSLSLAFKTSTRSFDVRSRVPGAMRVTTPGGHDQSFRTLGSCATAHFFSTQLPLGA